MLAHFLPFLSFLGANWWLYAIGAAIIAAVIAAFVLAPQLMALPNARLGAGIALAVGVGFLLYAHVTRVAYQDGYAKAVAEQKAATDKAVADTQAVADRWAAIANKASADEVNSENRYAQLKNRLAQALATKPDRPCIDSGIADQLLFLDGTKSVASPASGGGEQIAPGTGG